MVSIEEAWEALEDELLHAPDAQGTAIGAEDAARALALAVLDREHSEYRYPVGCSCITWADGDRCRGYREGRTRIECLGK